MRKRLLTVLLALLLAALPALAEGGEYAGNGYTVTLPEGLEVLSAEALRGYFEGAAADIGADAGEEPAVDYDAMMMAATADGKVSVNIIVDANDGGTAQEAAEAAYIELGELVDGLSATVTSATYGETEFACVSYRLYGNDIQQYFAVSGEKLYCVTCTNLDAAAAEAMLASFKPEA